MSWCPTRSWRAGARPARSRARLSGVRTAAASVHSPARRAPGSPRAPAAACALPRPSSARGSTGRVRPTGARASLDLRGASNGGQWWPAAPTCGARCSLREHTDACQCQHGCGCWAGLRQLVTGRACWVLAACEPIRPQQHPASRICSARRPAAPAHQPGGRVRTVLAGARYGTLSYWPRRATG